MNKDKFCMWLAKIFYEHIDPWFEKYRHTLSVCYYPYGGKIIKTELKFSSDDEMQAAVREIEDIIKKHGSETINKTIEK